MQNVENKVVLITGASSGIGEATARLLAKQGAIVVLGARRTERLAAIVRDIQQTGGQAAYHALDVVDAKQVNEFVTFAKDTFGRIDVMFNNAGIMPLSPMGALKTDEWNKIIDINIKGVLNGIAAVLPLMEQQGNGQIINTASTGAHAVGPSCAVYCASKYAVWAISEGLRQESSTIRVTVLSPGVTTTELGHDITDEAAAGLIEQLRTMSLNPDAIANAVLYAISQPDNVDVSELVIRSVSSKGHAF
ncbi:SDR family oxidoreductase [Alkalimonas collagenimarina]|uniref:SDR family oxidoreductase n=1 Tax=Alkalimonas collagenimarina TaxID=400390 RepID=A0ABT9GUP1_9GAMM|nr:SDR family oxidoreductase [Alkalimonas collagenimarina]MDP4534762.1 SDR family oxidoreductase [Alkalimonas collagenimarina]